MVKNSLLRAARHEKGWSQQQLADFAELSLSTIERAERGEPIRVDSMERLCTCLQKTPEQLGLIKGFESHEESAEEFALIQPGLKQSNIVTTPLIDINQAINDKLDNAESIINLAWETWFASRPKQAIKEITKLVVNLERMIYTPLFTAMHVLRTKELVIRCHGLLGAIYLDAIQKNSAFYHYMRAHQYAEEIHDTNLTATYLALMGDVLRQQNDKTTAIDYMENARDLATDPATKGHVLQILAYSYGDIGNEIAFEKTISGATDLLSFSDEGRDSAKKEFIPFEIYEIRGKINRDLGKPLKAITYLEHAEKSLDKIKDVTPRWQALLKISKGQAFCDADDITTGMDLIIKGFILASQCNSLHQMNRVRKLFKKMESGSVKNHPRVQDLKNLLFETYMNMDSAF